MMGELAARWLFPIAIVVVGFIIGYKKGKAKPNKSNVGLVPQEEKK